VTLCLDQIDADRLALRRRIENSLGRLEKETLISRNGDLYTFLTNEERDINKEIKQVDLASGEEAKLLGEIIFEDVLKGQRKHKFSGNSMLFDFNRRCDLFPVGNQKDGALLVSVISPLADDYEIYDKGKAILERRGGGNVLIRLGNDESLGRNCGPTSRPRNTCPAKRRHARIDQAHPAALRRGQPPAAEALTACSAKCSPPPNTSWLDSRSSSRLDADGGAGRGDGVPDPEHFQQDELPQAAHRRTAEGSPSRLAQQRHRQRTVAV
jgi:hypothetical protein